MLIPSVSFYLDVSEKQPHSTIVTEASSDHAFSMVIRCAHSVSQNRALLSSVASCQVFSHSKEKGK